MQEEFEKLDNVEDMFNFLASGDSEEMSDQPAPNELHDDLKILNVQILLRCFPIYMKLDEEQRKTFREAALIFNDPDQNMFIKQSALAAACELIFPEGQRPEPDEDDDDDDDEGKPEVQIIKKEKPYPTPCEECTATPTHKFEFRQKNRSEEHYLCEKCEEEARKNLE